MKKLLFILVGSAFALTAIALVAVLIISNFPKPPLETKFVQNVREETQETPEQESSVAVKTAGDFALLDNPKHTYQTFNNCGPATLSMMLSWYGKSVSQKELGDLMRPYQHPKGDNDDKTIFTQEFVDWAKKYGFEAVSRVNGDIGILKTFTANGIPVVVKTWLHSYDDIGHFRIVRGFDEKAQVIIQDDSYEGPNRKISYYDFLSLWQPFNYNYMVIFTKDQKDLVEAIIAEEMDDEVMWENMLARAQKEATLDAQNVYPWFTISIANYHLENFEESVKAFAQVESRLPKRMLWYQIEPIEAYRALKDYDRVFTVIERILDGGNRAYSELYIIRGEIYLEKGQTELARKEFEQAVFYNKNIKRAQELLESI